MCEEGRVSGRKIWARPELRAEWEDAISPKLVGFFERLVRARNPRGFKTKQQHHQDAEIPVKFIDRADGSLVEFLQSVGLIQVERRGELIGVSPTLPVTASPSETVPLPLYASWGRGPRASVNRQRVYDLDQGICAYCGKRQVSSRDYVIDHIYPFERGGADTEENLTVQCKAPGCRKWFYVPGDKGWRDPIFFRGRRVKRVTFRKKGKYFFPVFEFDD